MYWKHNGNSSSQIDVILCKEDLKLQEILEQEDLLQELKGQNLKLIEYLLRGDVMEELISLVISEPSDELPVTERYKYASIACEVLTCDLPALNERLASNRMLLDKLYNFIDQEYPVNPLLASYFSRVITVLISRKSEQNWYSYQMTCLQALEYLKDKEHFVNLLLRHLGVSAIMDLTLNLITLIEDSTLKQNSRQWLMSQNVIASLISLLNPLIENDRQNNAAQILCDIIYKLRYQVENDEIDPILAQIESTNTITFLMDTITNMEQLSECSLVGGILVLVEILRPFVASEPHSRRSMIFSVHDNNDNFKAPDSSPNGSGSENSGIVTNIVSGILPFISNLKMILMNPPPKSPVLLTTGLIDPPFGKVRLHIVKLLTMLVALNNSVINEELIRFDIFNLLLDLFFKYPWNNFLHTEVEKSICYTIDFCGFTDLPNNEPCMFEHILNHCRLFDRLLDELEQTRASEMANCDWNYQSATNQDEIPQRQQEQYKGYMGHVIRIVCVIYCKEKKNSVIQHLIDSAISSESLEKWNQLKINYLPHTVHFLTKSLGAVPLLSQQNDNEAAEDGKLSMDNEFKMENNSVMNLSDDRESIQPTSDIPIMNGGESGISDEQMEKSESMFNSMCAQKWQSFSKDLNNWDDDDEPDILTQPSSDDCVIWNNSCNIQSAESKENEIESSMENGEQNPWAKIGNVSNPWITNEFPNDSTSPISNWANFEDTFSDMFYSDDVSGSLSNEENGKIIASVDVATFPDSPELYCNQYGTIGEKADRKNESSDERSNYSGTGNSRKNKSGEEEDKKSSAPPSCENICESLFPAVNGGSFFVADIDKRTIYKSNHSDYSSNGANQGAKSILYSTTDNNHYDLTAPSNADDERNECDSDGHNDLSSVSNGTADDSRQLQSSDFDDCRQRCTFVELTIEPESESVASRSSIDKKEDSADKEEDYFIDKTDDSSTLTSPSSDGSSAEIESPSSDLLIVPNSDNDIVPSEKTDITSVADSSTEVCRVTISSSPDDVNDGNRDYDELTVNDNNNGRQQCYVDHCVSKESAGKDEMQILKSLNGERETERELGTEVAEVEDVTDGCSMITKENLDDHFDNSEAISSMKPA